MAISGEYSIKTITGRILDKVGYIMNMTDFVSILNNLLYFLSSVYLF